MITYYYYLLCYMVVFIIIGLLLTGMNIYVDLELITLR